MAKNQTKAMPAVKLIEDQTELGKLIDGIASRGKKLDMDIHVAACSAIAHFAKHGDVVFINRLYLAMPKGSRSSALVDWLFTFGGVVANTDSKGKKNNPFLKDKDKTVRVAEAQAKPWFLFKPEKAPDEVLDVLALTLAVIKRAQGTKAQIEHAEVLEKLKAIAEEYGESTEPAGEPAPF